MKAPVEIAPAQGKLGILLVGLGAVSTTTIAGVFAIRKGIAKPIGSLTQMGTIRLGKRTENRSPMIKDFVPLASLDDLVFGGWDIFEDNCYEAAKTAGVLDERCSIRCRTRWRPSSRCRRSSTPFYVKRLDGPNVKKGKNKKDLAEQVIADIRQFKADNKLRSAGDGLVRQHRDLHDRRRRPTSDLAAFERRSRRAIRAIPSSMIYAYAAIKEGIPYANGAPTSARTSRLSGSSRRRPRRRSPARTSRPARR